MLLGHENGDPSHPGADRVSPGTKGQGSWNEQVGPVHFPDVAHDHHVEITRILHNWFE